MNQQQSEHDEDNTFAKEALLCEIGAKLEQARQAKGLSKEQVLKELKFNPSFLDALENGRWSDMPGEVYAIGFLRQYAGLLGLDFSEEIERIKTNSYELTTPLTYPDAPISPNRTWAIVAVLLFILGILVANLFSGMDTSDEVVVTQRQPAPTKQIDTPAVSNQAATSGDDLYTKPVAVHMTPVSTPDNHKPEQATSSEENLTGNNTAMPKASQAPAASQPAPVRVPQPGSLQAFTFEAVTDDVWLQIFEVQPEQQEPVLKREALLRMGQSFGLESKYPLLITAGKPTALKITRNGEVLFDVGTLGEEGKILKLFPL